jgi:hypothetical protein
MVVAKVRKRLSARKQAAQETDVEEKFNLKKLSAMEVRKQYHTEISNRFAALKNLYDKEDIKRAWKNIKENIKISVKDTLRPYEKMQTKMQWLHDPNQSNAEDLNNASHETSRNFRNKKREYMKAKIN